MFGRFIAVIMGLVGAAGGTQAPGFTLQYMQNLEGRLDELRPIVRQFDENVGKYGYSRVQALLECGTAQGLLDALCEGYETTILRYEELSAHMETLASASDIQRPLVLAREVKRDIAESVMEQFEPTVTVSTAGAAYAGGGFAALWGGLSFIFGLFGAMFGTERRYV